MKRRALRLATAWIACLSMGASTPLHAQATPIDSLTTALASPDFNVRHEALRRINESYSNPMPAQLVNGVVALLNREASANPSPSGEDYGEYIMELVIAGSHTNDARANDGLLKLGGVGVSGGVGSFLARQGASILPSIKAFAELGEQQASDAVTVYGLMLGRHGSLLSRADSAQVFAALLGIAGGPPTVAQDELAFVASRIPLPEFLPVIQAMTAANPQMLEGPKAVAVLTALQSSTPPIAILGRLQVSLEGVCVGASGDRNGTCTSLQNRLDNAIKHVEAGRTLPAKNALSSFANRADSALQQGSFTAMEHHLFAETARLIASRL